MPRGGNRDARVEPRVTPQIPMRPPAWRKPVFRTLDRGRMFELAAPVPRQAVLLKLTSFRYGPKVVPFPITANPQRRVRHDRDTTSARIARDRVVLQLPRAGLGGPVDKRT